VATHETVTAAGRHGFIFLSLRNEALILHIVRARGCPEGLRTSLSHCL
jgi:hypothetical protein